MIDLPIEFNRAGNDTHILNAPVIIHLKNNNSMEEENTPTQ